MGAVDKGEHWQDYAECTGEDPDIFFPDPHYAEQAYGIARRICNRCPVRDICLEHALSNRIKHGMWGAMTPPERKREKKRRREER